METDTPNTNDLLGNAPLPQPVCQEEDLIILKSPTAIHKLVFSRGLHVLPSCFDGMSATKGGYTTKTNKPKTCCKKQTETEDEHTLLPSAS